MNRRRLPQLYRFRIVTLSVILSLALVSVAQAQGPVGDPPKPEMPSQGASSPTGSELPQNATPPQADNRATTNSPSAPPTGIISPAIKPKDGPMTPDFSPLATGGPDAYGYRFADNVSAASCNTTFTDISGTGTALSLGDDDEANVTMPFSFDFYGTTSTSLRIGNNGGILFGTASGDIWAGNASLPYDSIGPAILPFWDDLYTAGNVYYATVGTTPNRRFIIQWNGRNHYSYQSGYVTFQAVFYEGNRGIDFVYDDVVFGSGTYDLGASATVGIQNGSGTALQYSSDNPSLANGRAICFRNPNAGGETCSEATDAGFFTDTEGCNGVAAWLGAGSGMDVSGAIATGGPYANCWLETSVQNDVWYKWTNNTGAPVYVRTSTDMLVNGNAANGDSQIGVWSGCSGGSGTGQLFCSDDGGDVGNTWLSPNRGTNITVANGATVYMQFDGYYTNTAFDTFVFACAPISSIATPPANDACSAAQGVTGPPYNNGGLNMSGATVAGNDPKASCMYNSGEQRGGGTVWYRYQPITSGIVTATCQGVSQTDCVIAAYTGSCGSLTQVTGACADSAGNGGTETITFNGVGGTTYYFMVTTFSISFALDNVTFTLAGPLAVTLAEFFAQQQDDAILVTWETASELDNRGFNLWRGTSPAGPDVQLNDLLIPSQSQGSPGGFVYTWQDQRELAPGATYYYWLEDVDVSGAVTRHGPVSVDYSAPTAVTLSSLAASPAAGGALPLAGALLALLLPLAGAAWAQRRR